MRSTNMQEKLNSGSYLSGDVVFLLQPIDPQDVQKPCLQSDGTEGYRCTLNAEIAPSDAILSAFNKALEDNVVRMATTLKKTGDFLRSRFEVDSPIILISLVPDGVPAGVVLHRYIGEVAPCVHYALSFIRGIGVDFAALNYIIDLHGTDKIVFVVDVGSDEFLRELSDSLNEYPELFDKDHLRLVSMVWSNGDHDDWVAPTKLLGCTATGLVSKGCLHEPIDPILAMDDFSNQDNWHKCVFNQHLDSIDVSQAYVNRIYDAVSALPSEDV